MKNKIRNSIVIAAILFTGITEAQIITQIFPFTFASGNAPTGSLVLKGGKFFGMTSYGGLGHGSGGIVFSIDTNGSNEKTLLNFNDTMGSSPYGSLIISKNKLYGMTSAGGTNFWINSNYNHGCIFTIDTTGKNYKELHYFTGSGNTDGLAPHGSLLLLGAKLYGMTSAGGNLATGSSGCIFSIDTNGSGYKIVYTFRYNLITHDTDGSTPYGSLIYNSGQFFGMASSGGRYDSGCVFSIDTNGSNYKRLIDFEGKGINGKSPNGDLVYAFGKLYGMTELGGANYCGTIFSLNTNGSSFNSVDFSYQSFPNHGAKPMGSLSVFGSNLYGMTFWGSNTNNYGNIFSISSNLFTFAMVYDFSSFSRPEGSLLISGDHFYGMTNLGGSHGGGVIFGYDTTLISTSNQPIKTSHFTIYPSPFVTDFNVVLDQPATVTLYDILGHQVYRQVLPTGNDLVSPGSVPTGIYFINVDGICKKIIKE